MFSNDKKTLFILIGIQGSGKSSFTHKYLSSYKYISLDLLNTRNKERIALEDGIKLGSSCVIDNTNPTKMERKKYIDYAKSNGYKVVGVYFRSVVSECIERNSKRTSKAQVPIKAILSTAKKLEQPTYDEGFDELYYVKIENNDYLVSKWDDTL